MEKQQGGGEELRGPSPLPRVRVPRFPRRTRAASFWVAQLPHPTPTPTLVAGGRNPNHSEGFSTHVWSLTSEAGWWPPGAAPQP